MKRFRTWTKVSAVCHYFQRVCQNNNLHIQRSSSMKNNYCKKRILFWSFSDNERKSSGRLAISFRLSCQNCTPDLRRKSWVIKWKSQLFSSFLVIERKCVGLLSNTLLGFVKIAFYLSMGFFSKKKFFGTKNLYFIIFAQRANSSGVLLDFFRRGTEKCFIGVQKNILEGKNLRKM